MPSSTIAMALHSWIAEDCTSVGNFPQVFTHLGLLQTALVLDLHECRGVAAVRGTYADRALRDTVSRTLAPMTCNGVQPP
jgi:hypothetical protein